MDTYSILDKQEVAKSASRNVVLSSARQKSGVAAAPARAKETLRFPGEDGGKSLSEMAQRDLDATLQLLAERAQYITGASGAAIALRQQQTMICCASAGPSAPELGAHLEVESGLSGESVRTRQTLHCDDAENDPRVNRESCQAFGIASVVVMPLIRGEEVFGVFELLADRPYAFEERDFVALQRLAEMIQTAVELAEAAKRAERNLAGKPAPIPSLAASTSSEVAQSAAIAVDGRSETVPEISPLKATQELKSPKNGESILGDTALEYTAESGTKAQPHAELQPTSQATSEALKVPLAELEESSEPVQIMPIGLGSVRTCVACGFPVSPSRKLCLDCEAVTPSVDLNPASEFDAQPASNPSWVLAHLYLIAAALLVAASIAVVIWRF